VRRASRAAVFAWAALGLVGCAAISGLDQIHESPCVFDCDAGGGGDASGGDDSTGDTSSTADSGRAPDATTDTASSDDSDASEVETDGYAHADGNASDGPDHPVDARADARDGEANGGDARTDAHDAQEDVRPADGAPQEDASCGPLNTPANCGACGTTCSSSATSPGVMSANCTGSTCQYTCKSGYLDCNASVPPDTDGCECATPGSIGATCCPGNACPTGHATGYAMGATGLDQTFYDCNTSVNQQVALEACAQYSGNAMYCATGDSAGAACPNGDLVVCNFSAPLSQNAVCWVYSGPGLGWVAMGTTPTNYLCAPGIAGTGFTQYH
jgi:hypothetical protein